MDDLRAYAGTAADRRYECACINTGARDSLFDPTDVALGNVDCVAGKVG
jgi:hypothetical protein